MQLKLTLSNFKLTKWPTFFDLLTFQYNIFCQSVRFRIQRFSGKLLLGFSLYKNTKVLFSISNKSNPDHLLCLNGIRSISITWVILGHVYSGLTSHPSNTNVPYSQKVYTKIDKSQNKVFLKVTFFKLAIPSRV